MTIRLVECVPNFSEGRRPEVLDAIVAAIAAVPGASVLDASMDAHHHRAVVTFVAPPDDVVDAAFAAVRTAREHIDLRAHRGVHPRIGATDVVPFVPLAGVTMDDCVALARRLGERVGRELEIPVYLYDRAATRPERRHLADVRRGEFEGLSTLVASDPTRAPDFGPSRLHVTAGAVAIGARDILVAYNVHLGPAANLPIARGIAREVRASSGGLPGVKALALEVDSQAQLSMNLVDLAATSLHAAHAAVERAARARGVEPTWSEIIGLVPERALLEAGADRLRLRDGGAGRVLEQRLRAMRPADGVDALVQAIASSEAAPGGGSAAAAAGALAAACARLVSALPPRPGAPSTLAFAELGADARRLGEELLALATADAAAWDAVRAAQAAARGAADVDATGVAAVQAALLEAARVPLRIAAACADVAALAERAASTGATHSASDAGASALLAEAACRAAADTVRVNAAVLRDRSTARALLDTAAAHVARASNHATAARREVERALAGRDAPG